jgi:hypothetical protein
MASSHHLVHLDLFPELYWRPAVRELLATGAYDKFQTMSVDRHGPYFQLTFRLTTPVFSIPELGRGVRELFENVQHDLHSSNEAELRVILWPAVPDGYTLARLMPDDRAKPVFCEFEACLGLKYRLRAYPSAAGGWILDDPQQKNAFSSPGAVAKAKALGLRPVGLYRYELTMAPTALVNAQRSPNVPELLGEAYVVVTQCVAAGHGDEMRAYFDGLCDLRGDGDHRKSVWDYVARCRDPDELRTIINVFKGAFGDDKESVEALRARLQRLANGLPYNVAGFLSAAFFDGARPGDVIDANRLRDAIAFLRSVRKQQQQLP